MTRPPVPNVLYANQSRPEWQDRDITDTGELAVFLGGSHDSFTGLLLNLMAKGDPGNRARLALAFPYESIIYELWAASPETPTYAQLRELYHERHAPPDDAEQDGQA